MDTRLGSWHDGPTTAAITGFVGKVTRSGGREFVPPEQRVAVFDNDGTLWCEKPLQIELDFILRRLAAQAAGDPDLRHRQPWQAAYEQDLGWLGGAVTKHYHGDDTDMQQLLGAIPTAFAGQRVEEYGQQVWEFFQGNQHPTLHRPYLACGYQPMVELMRYLEGHGFATYIASGGDRDFMRPVAPTMYGVPPERVIGSSQELEYRSDGNSIRYRSTMEFFDDGLTKPVRIWSRTGRRPILAAGNANGDIPMFEYTGGSLPALRLLVRHDDAEREFDYSDGAEQALEQAEAHQWTVVSVKHDWRQVFRTDPVEVSRSPPGDHRPGAEAAVPLRLPGTRCLAERLPAGAAAVLLNPSHPYPDLLLPSDADELRLFAAIDGRRTVGELARQLRLDPPAVTAFLRRLWWYDQVAFDESAGAP